MTTPLAPATLQQLPKAVTSNALVPKGGVGSADQVMKTLGNMNDQIRGPNGAIAPKGGVGLTESLVPVVLILANNAVTKNALRSTGISKKVLDKALPQGGENMPPELTEGGNLANTIAIPAGLVLASHMVAKSARRTERNVRRPRRRDGKSRRYRR